METTGCTALSLAMLVSFGCLASTEREETEATARSIVKTYVGEVRPMLQNYMQTRGPVGAVDGCARDAPAIADRIGEDTGWQVGRVSLKPRNVERASPDDWEIRTLEQLETARREGTPAEDLNHGEWVDGRYRYMQAQLVDGVCLACHGESIDPAVRASIDKHYPGDSAVGFSIGDIRGAITLTSPGVD